jgi:hypothetical protein
VAARQSLVNGRHHPGVLSAIPSAVDPHTVERACPAVTRWSAPRPNDLVTAGQVCSALPGSMVGGMATIPEA